MQELTGTKEIFLDECKVQKGMTKKGNVNYEKDFSAKFRSICTNNEVIAIIMQDSMTTLHTIPNAKISSSRNHAGMAKKYEET